MYSKMHNYTRPAQQSFRILKSPAVPGSSPRLVFHGHLRVCHSLKSFGLPSLPQSFPVFPRLFMGHSSLV